MYLYRDILKRLGNRPQSCQISLLVHAHLDGISHTLPLDVSFCCSLAVLFSQHCQSLRSSLFGPQMPKVLI